ncbi:hypothetical protein CVD28_03315 [Bacillus sp. M6-12]|uniref:hypothetical protein n=1 Tax=Bacillus sp. M6-12 TaxID=2054166 RepID=UPI000C77B9A6|nr:hypothetical protein [Bacillus sp. M6-12]PLS19459.1 hypothetical protein CVD28_03315 [Bacillus sp. M6-12]
MGTCNALGCGFGVEEILVKIDNGQSKVTLCPNHILMLKNNLFNIERVYTEPSERHDKNPCECCNEQDSIEYKDHDATMYLCAKHLGDLIDRNLSPRDFKTLYHKYGNIYILHDDFYHPETGEAFQPVER